MSRKAPLEKEEEKEEEGFPAARMLKASAGTGKTFQLTNRYLAVLSRGERIDRILATTFTRKAASEIRERVFSRLAAAALSETNARELGAELGRRGFTRNDALAILRGVARNQHRLLITTLDSFFLSIVKSFDLDFGVPPHWQILDEVLEQPLKRSALSLFLARCNSEELLGLLQLLRRGETRRSVFEALLIDIEQLHETFLATSKESWSAIEIPPRPDDEAIKKALSLIPGAPVPTTQKGEPHKAWGPRLVQDLDAFTERDWLGFLKDGISGAVLQGNPKWNRADIPAQLREPLQVLVEEASGALLEEFVSQNRALHRTLLLFDEAYSSLKRSAGALTIAEAGRLLSTISLSEQTQELYYRLDTRLAHVLLDEFQDTSLDEWQVLAPLVDEIVAQPDGFHSFFCVGDVKQSIYRWRGGVAEIFSSLEKHYTQMSTGSMELSYRSSPVIIEAVNRLCGSLTSNSELGSHVDAVTDWLEGFSPHETVQREYPGYVTLRTPEAPFDGEDTLEYACSVIRELAENAPGLSIGVLTRTNLTVPHLVFQLRQGDYPIFASEEGGAPLTDSRAVNAVLSLFFLADHPGDIVSRFAVAHSPLGAICRFESFADDSRCDRLSHELRSQLLAEGYGETVEYYARQLLPKVTRRDRERLGQLISLSYLYDESTGATNALRPSDFVRFARDKRIQRPAQSQVRVMTIHQAKGLEFDIVVLPELGAKMAWNRYPRVLTHRERMDGPITTVARYPNKVLCAISPALAEMHAVEERAQVRESLNLLYVAMTRAVFGLYMVVPTPKPGRNQHRIPSFAAVLKEAFAPGNAQSDVQLSGGSVFFEMGDAGYLSNAVKLRSKKTVDVTPREGKAPRLKPASARRARALERLRPSQHVAKRVEDCLRLSDEKEMLRGKIFHAFFESVQWLDDGAPAEESLIANARKKVPESPVPPESLESFYKMLAQPGVGALLKRARYVEQGLEPVECRRELAFAQREGNTLITGVIDRVVLCRSGKSGGLIEVIDFKTDDIAALSAEMLAVRIEQYKRQLRMYGEVTRKLVRGSVEVSLVLAFVQGDRLIVERV